MGDTRSGLLLALDGVDGVGKTLQCERLGERLEAGGRSCLVLREPGGSALGEKLRAILLAREGRPADALVEAMLFFASRRQLTVEKIAPALATGRVVLLDRSFLSTWVYQGHVGGVDLAFLEDCAKLAMGEHWPDRILLLDLSAVDAAKRRGERVGTDGYEERGERYLESVVDAYREAAARAPELVRCVDASRPAAEVTDACLAELADLLPAEGDDSRGSGR